jgi:hypothetical protein
MNHGMTVCLISRIVLNNLDCYIQKELSVSDTVLFTLQWRTRDHSGSRINRFMLTHICLFAARAVTVYIQYCVCYWHVYCCDF